MNLQREIMTRSEKTLKIERNSYLEFQWLYCGRDKSEGTKKIRLKSREDLMNGVVHNVHDKHPVR